MRTLSRVYGVCLLLAAASAGGCLRKEVHHTLYLAPADVTWAVAEADVRSDDPDPAARLVEEQDYLLAARAGRHGVARALTAAGATRVGTSILRTDRPFAVRTEGHFRDLAALVRAVLAYAGARGDATIERNGCTQTFRAWIDASQEASGGGEDFAELAAEASAYRMVLTEGRFVNASGFAIVDEGAVAIPVDAIAPENGIVSVSLAWTDGRCGGDGR